MNAFIVVYDCLIILLGGLMVKTFACFAGGPGLDLDVENLKFQWAFINKILAGCHLDEMLNWPLDQCLCWVSKISFTWGTGVI